MILKCLCMKFLRVNYRENGGEIQLDANNLTPDELNDLLSKQVVLTVIISYFIKIKIDSNNNFLRCFYIKKQIKYISECLKNEIDVCLQLGQKGVSYVLDNVFSLIHNGLSDSPLLFVCGFVFLNNLINIHF